MNRAPSIDPVTEYELRAVIRDSLEVFNRDGLSIPQIDLDGRTANLMMAIVGNFAGHCPCCHETVPIRSLDDVTEPIPMAISRPM